MRENLSFQFYGAVQAHLNSERDRARPRLIHRDPGFLEKSIPISRRHGQAQPDPDGLSSGPSKRWLYFEPSRSSTIFASFGP